MIKPTESDWIESDGRSFQDAVQQWHFDHYELGVGITVSPTENTLEHQSFALFQNDFSQRLISCCCKTGIWRKGKASQEGGLHYVAERLGLPVSSLEGPWDNEQDWER